MSSLVLHVPHASTTIPDDVWPEFVVPRSSVEAEALVSADLHTDEMARKAWPHATIVEAQISRIVVDVERYDDDSKEEMAEVGRGVLYTHDHRRTPLRQRPGQDRREELLDRYYRPHWDHLRKLAADAIRIDPHTYPPAPWPIERHSQGPRPEIDLGFTPGLTPSGWVEKLTDHFKQHGYDVGHNTPYFGVIDAGARAAVMIEIRRDIVGTPGSDRKWQRLISALSKAPVGV